MLGASILRPQSNWNICWLILELEWTINYFTGTLLRFLNKIKCISTAVKDSGLQLSCDMTVNDFKWSDVCSAAREMALCVSITAWGLCPRVWATQRLSYWIRIEVRKSKFLASPKEIFRKGCTVSVSCWPNFRLSVLQLWNVAALWRANEKWYIYAICWQCVQLTAAGCPGNDYITTWNDQER